MAGFEKEDFQHFKLPKVYKLVKDLQKDHDKKMISLNTAFVRIYDILIANNIDPFILEEMETKILSPILINYSITSKNYTFSIDLNLKITKRDPGNVNFMLKNANTKLQLSEKFKLETYDNDFSTKFMMYFRNSFFSYYSA